MLNSLAVAVAVMGMVIAFVIYAAMADPAARPSSVFRYEGVEYTDLLLRPMSISVARAVNPAPNENCFTLTDANMHVFPAGTMDSIAEADANVRDFLEPARVEGPDYPPSTVLNATNSDALRILEKYDNFNTRVGIVDRNYLNIPDNTYDFECLFQYGDNQYRMRVYFGTYYPMDSMFSTIVFERNEQGEPFVENPDILVSSGDVNGTVLFVNNLGEDAVLRYENSYASPDSTEIQTLEKTIPAGRMLPVDIGQYLVPDDGTRTYSYSVTSHGLGGTITKRPHPACITDMQGAKSYYAPAGALLKFPSYLHDSYRLHCGVHADSSNFIATYADEELAAKPEYGRGLGDKFLADGGLSISYTNYLAFAFWDRDLMQYNKSEIAESYADQPEFRVESMDGNPVVIGQRTVFIDGQERTINTVQVFQDVDSYLIQGSLPHEELLKVAQSLEL